MKKVTTGRLDPCTWSYSGCKYLQCCGIFQDCVRVNAVKFDCHFCITGMHKVEKVRKNQVDFFFYHEQNLFYPAQWWVFNIYSLEKHRPLSHYSFNSVLKTEITNWPWILPQLTTKIRKITLDFYLMDLI